jgi:hypothetical protein
MGDTDTTSAMEQYVERLEKVAENLREDIEIAQTGMAWARFETYARRLLEAAELTHLDNVGAFADVDERQALAMLQRRVPQLTCVERLLEIAEGYFDE